MIKIILLTSIIIATSSLGIYISNLYKSKITLLFDFIRFCDSYEANLDFFQTNLEDFILKFCQNSSLEFSDLILNKFNLNPKSSSGYTFFKKQKLLNEEELKYVNNFFSILGKSDIITQKKQIESYKHYFVEEYDKSKINYNTKGKLCGKLGLLFGFFISILLV